MDVVDALGEGWLCIKYLDTTGYSVTISTQVANGTNSLIIG